MGKAQSKRSVDITTENRKGTDDEITEKMEKINDLDKRDVNGDATITEKSDQEKNCSAEIENKDRTLEKEVEVEVSGDGPAFQNSGITSREEGGPSVTAEEISALSDESIKKSKKEKVKKKWSFRSISFGKKDKQKPAKTEDPAEDCGADTENKNEPEDTQKEGTLTNESKDQTTENPENGDATPHELNDNKRNDEKGFDEAPNDITANTTNNIKTTETCEPVQNETATVSSELSEKTENIALIKESKISENDTIIKASENGLDVKMSSTETEAQETDIVTNASVKTSSEKTCSTLDSAVINESLVSTNGEVVDQIHQNGDHGEFQQEIVEKSRAQTEVNTNTDNVFAATPNYISSNSICPSNVQTRIPDLCASSDRLDEIIEIDEIESVIQNSTDIMKNNGIVDQFSVTEVPVVDVKNEVSNDIESNLTSELTKHEKSCDRSPPPLPISSPPSHVLMFAFTNNDECIEDSIQIKKLENTFNQDKEKEKEIPSSLAKPHATQKTDTISSINISEKDYHIEFEGQDNKAVGERSVCEDLNKDDQECLFSAFKNSQEEEKTSIDIAAAVINEIAERAAEIVNHQLKCNEEHTMNELPSKLSEDKVVKSNLVDNKDHIESEIAKSLKEPLLTSNQTHSITSKCSLDFTSSCLIVQPQDEMTSQEKSDKLLEDLYSTKEFATTAKDIQDATVAEITQDLSATCE